jgi:hypothetical protein
VSQNLGGWDEMDHTFLTVSSTCRQNVFFLNLVGKQTILFFLILLEKVQKRVCFS